MALSRRWFLAGSLGLVARRARAQAQSLPLSDLAIVTSSGRHRFRVELANTDQARTIGLMHRRSLAADAGMLFDYGFESPISMWMRNTFIPLDMLFIKADGRILHIHERAIPHDLTPIPSGGPVRAVLELNGGTAARIVARRGDLVEHAVFGKR